MGIPKKLAKEKTWLEWVIRIVAVSLGAFIMAFGLELFLIPNNVLDGGVVGVSIISSHFMNVPMGTLVFFINIPFIFIGYKQLGKTFTILTGIGIAVLSISSTYLHQFDAITDELLLATVYGGTLIGIGVGIAIKFGGCLDGSEVLAILFEQKTRLSVSQMIIIINIIIFAVAGFVFSWERALLSLLTYFIASKLIDVVVNGAGDEDKGITILTEKGEEIAEVVYARLGRATTFIPTIGAYSKKQTYSPYIVINRIEKTKLVDIVKEIDPNAMIIVSPISDVKGERYKRRDIH